MTEVKPVHIISDNPGGGTSADTAFGFDAYAQTLAGLIANRKNETPLVIGIYGPWGSGKTTLMKAIRNCLEGDTFQKSNDFRPCKTVWFQAWKYGDQDEILAALIKVIFEHIKQDESFLKRLNGEIEKVSSSINLHKGVLKLVKDFIGVDMSEFIDAPKYREKLSFYTDFQDFLDRLIWTYTRLRPKFTSSEEPDDAKGAMVVFIDDLDRCPRQRVVKVLETIKLFMDRPGCMFVIGAAEEIVEEALKQTYKDENARKFMDKIVQVTFKLPTIARDDFTGYLEAIHPESSEMLAPFLTQIVATVQANPRRFKRFVNDLSLLGGLHRSKGTGIDDNSLLFWKLIEFEDARMAEEIRTNPAVFSILKTIISDHAFRNEMTGQYEIPPDKLETVREKSLLPFLEQRELIELIANLDLTEEQLRQLIYFNAVAETKEVMLKASISGKTWTSNVTLTVGPALEMVNIEAGEFLLGLKKEPASIDVPYEIDIYPVTNRRFSAFIEANGYSEEGYWSERGKNWYRFETVASPEFWTDNKWNQPDHPVIGVSMYEANAYCNWLTQTLDDGCEYRLPSEEEWERAARGKDGLEYPWGNDFDTERCNTSESGINSTTRVTRYPNGISPDGCYDMAGNAWEWTATQIDDDYVIKGGSWVVGREGARCGLRYRYEPYSRSYFTIGFRCVRIKK